MSKSPRSHKVDQTSGEGGPPPRPVHDPAAAIAALGALYQGEKTDASYIFNTAMAMMGVAVVYLVGAVPFLGSIRQLPLGWLFLLLVPMPLWIIVAFHSLITLNAMNHGISVQIIEQELYDASELTGNRERVGSAAGDRIMDIGVSKPIHKLTTVFVYVGIAFLVLGFTYYVLHLAYDVIGQAPTPLRNTGVWTVGILYCLVFVMVGFSWWVGLRDVGAGRKELKNHVRRFGGTERPSRAD